MREFKKLQINIQLISCENSSRLSLSHLESKIGPRTQLMSHRLYHPVLGSMNDQHVAIRDVLKAHGILYHVDVTTALGDCFWDLESIDADFVSVDINTAELKGTVLFSRDALLQGFMPSRSIDLELAEKIKGYFEKLYEVSSEAMLKKITEKMHLMTLLKEHLPQVKVMIEPPLQGLSKVIFHFPNVHQDAMNYMLKSHGIIADLGGGSEQTLFSLLEIMGFDALNAATCLGIDLAFIKDSSQIDHLVSALKSSYMTLIKGAI
jgi:selenocysteine lyase/cysteine desulfurase